MHYLVIAGVLGSRKFSMVLSVAMHLEKKYPYTIFKKIFVKHYNWKEWLDSITKKNGWNHFSLPIIWKEIPFRGGKRCLIGGCHMFLEYCSEMFNFDFTFTPENMKFSGYQMLIKEIQDTKELQLLNDNFRKVCIYGAGSVLLPLFLPLLLRTPGLATHYGLRVALFDEDKSKKELLEDIVKEFDCIVPQDSCTAYFTSYIVHNIFQATKECDLFILIIPQFQQLQDEYNECWSQSVSYAVRAGWSLSQQSKENTRVILVSESGKTPICLCAAAFYQAASPNISLNVVAVTASIGIIMRSMLAHSLEVSVHQIKEVPVWGFVGVSHLLDLSLALTDEEKFCDSELLQKFQSHTMLRNDFLFSHLWPLFERRQEVLLKRNPYWSTVEALMDTLHKWYSEDSCEKIAFLGICSDGTFGIPPGVYFSQPAILTGGIWRPYEAHSLPSDRFCTIDNLCCTAAMLTEIYLNKDLCKYGLMGLNVEMDYEYFLNGERLNEKLYSTTCGETAISEEYGMLKRDRYYLEDIVKNLTKELIQKILIGTQHEEILPCLFHYEESYILISALMKEMICKILHEKQLEYLIPCLFSTASDTEYVTSIVKDSIAKILTEMKLEELIDCIIPQDNKDFIIATMKDLIHTSLNDLQQQALMPYIFP